MSETINKEDLMRDMHKCVSQWLEGHAHVIQDAQTLLDAYTTFKTDDENVKKLFFFLNKSARFDAILGFESELVYKKKVLPVVPNENFGDFQFPSKKNLNQFFNKWLTNRLKTIQETIDEKRTLMENWLIFDLRNDFILKALAKVFSSGSIQAVIDFEEKNIQSLRFQVDLLAIEIQQQSSHENEAPPLYSITQAISDFNFQVVDTDHEKKNEEPVSRLFVPFLRRMAKKNERLRKYFQFDDNIREKNEYIEKVVVSEFFANAKDDDTPDMSGLSLETTEQKDASPERKKIDPSRIHAAMEFSHYLGKPIELDDSMNLQEVLAEQITRTQDANKEAIFNLTRRENEKVKKERKERERVELSKFLMHKLNNVQEICYKSLREEEAERLANEWELTQMEKEIRLLQTVDSEQLGGHAKRVLDEFQAIFEDYRSRSTNLKKEIAEELATRYVEMRYTTLNKMTEAELNEVETMRTFKYYYRIVTYVGVSKLTDTIKLQLCFLQSMRLQKNYFDLELAFFATKDFRDALIAHYDAEKEELSKSETYTLSDEHTRELYDAAFSFYLECYKHQDYEDTIKSAVEYWECQLESLQKEIENNSNDKAIEKFKIYQRLLETDPLDIAEETMFESGMLKLQRNNPAFSVFETVFLEDLQTTYGNI